MPRWLMSKMKRVKKFIGLTLLSAALLYQLLNYAVSAPIEVKVHFDSFPPYFILKDSKRSGIGVDLIEIMNDF